MSERARLIEIPPQASLAALAERAAQSAGGFGWWYVDLINAEGDGCVAIWAQGLPFLPGYAASARAGRAPMARERVSFNLVIYRAGRPDFYILQESPPIQPEQLRQGEEFAWRAELDIPGVRGRAQVAIDIAPGPLVRVPPQLESGGLGNAPFAHVWRPLRMAAEGRARVRVGDASTPARDRYEVDIAGRAYHDCNFGTQPLEHVGIERWIWGRFAMPDGSERILYSLTPSRDPRGQSVEAPVTWMLSVSREGALSAWDASAFDGTSSPQLRLAGGWRRWLGGLSSPERLEFKCGSRSGAITLGDAVDRGPFYLRFLPEIVEIDRVSGAEQRARGVLEIIVPKRIDLDWQRWLVSMRVHRAQGRNSVWLPLFAGPRARRVERLLRHWWDRGIGRGDRAVS